MPSWTYREGSPQNVRVNLKFKSLQRTRMSKMVLLSKNLRAFHSVFWAVLNEDLHVLSCGGGRKSFSIKVWSSLLLSICFLRGLHLWAGLTGRRRGRADGPSPDLEILQPSRFNWDGPRSDLCVRSGKSKTETLTKWNFLPGERQSQG